MNGVLWLWTISPEGHRFSYVLRKVEPFGVTCYRWYTVYDSPALAVSDLFDTTGDALEWAKRLVLPGYQHGITF